MTCTALRCTGPARFAGQCRSRRRRPERTAKQAREGCVIYVTWRVKGAPASVGCLVRVPNGKRQQRVIVEC